MEYLRELSFKVIPYQKLRTIDQIDREVEAINENREQLDYTLQLLNSTVLLMQGAMLPRTFSPFTLNTPDGKEVNPYGGFAD